MGTIRSIDVPCGYLNSTQNINSVLQGLSLQAEASPSEIASNVISTCPEICAAIYGNGNPDISGIGVFVSFLVQAVYWALFRPLLASLFLFLPKDIKNKKTKAVLARLKRLSEAIHGTSIFLNFTTLVAGAVRMRQSPPEYEALYLRRLGNYIAVMSRGSFIVSTAFAHGPIESDRDRWYDVMDFGTSILADYVQFVASKYQSRLILIRAVATECSDERSYPATPKDTADMWYLLLFMMAASGVLSPIIAWKFGDRLYSLYKSERGRLFRQMSNSKTFWVSLFMIYNTITLVCALGDMVIIADTRSAMKAAISSPYLDNQWGFGQVTAIMIWVPITMWILRWLLKAVLKALREPLSKASYWILTVVFRTQKLDTEARPTVTWIVIFFFIHMPVYTLDLVLDLMDPTSEVFSKEEHLEKLREEARGGQGQRHDEEQPATTNTPPQQPQHHSDSPPPYSPQGMGSAHTSRSLSTAPAASSIQRRMSM